MNDFEPHGDPITVEVPAHLQPSLAWWLAEHGFRLSPLPVELDTDLPAYEIREATDG